MTYTYHKQVHKKTLDVTKHQEMQIKTAMRDHYTTVRMVVIIKKKSQVLTRLWRNWNTCIVEGMQNSSDAMESSMKVSQNIKNRTTTSNPTYGYLSRRFEIRISKKN